MQTGSESAPWKQIALFLITLGTLIVTALILKPFLPAIVGAIVVAVVTERPHRWLATKIGSPNLCAVVALILITLSIIVPIFFLGQSVGEQIGNVVTAVRSKSTQQEIADYFSRHPVLASRILAISNSIDLQRASQSA